jgi:DNA polymerase elongation subunit (family B)
MDLAVCPSELLKRGTCYRINSLYYITKCVLPALDRVLGLCGVQVSDVKCGLPS